MKKKTKKKIMIGKMKQTIEKIKEQINQFENNVISVKDMLDSSMTIVCDIDGVLAEKSHKGDYDKAVVMPNGRDAINYLYDKGYKIVLATARGGDSFPGKQYQMWYTRTYNWLVENGIKFHELQLCKPPGIIYIDDKAARVEFDSKEDWDTVFQLLEDQKNKDKYGNKL